MTITYSLVNQKGGVGKTTTAINLGAYLALAGQRVLLVDSDPQANATSCLGVNHAKLTGGLYEVLLSGDTAARYILHNPDLHISLLPSTASLAGARVEIVNMPRRETLLRDALAEVAGRFDYILIDCPPSLGLLTLNGLLAAADGVIIPIQCEYLALEGLTQLMHTLRRVRTGLFPGLTIRGLLLTMYDARTNLSEDVAREVRRHFPDRVFRAVIPRNVRVAEAPSYGLPISAYAPRSPGARAYQALAGELMRGDGTDQGGKGGKGGTGNDA
jgi:chromosome partitioning protein